MLCSLIKDRKPCVSLVDKQTNRVSVYSIKCDLHEQNIIAIFDKRRGKICTFLPIGTTKETIEWEKFDDIESELWEGEKHEEEHLL
jgi:hypothetical protein